MKVLFRAEWTATAESPRPDVGFIPAMERRRLTTLEKAALAVAYRALLPFAAAQPGGATLPVAGIPVVFASRWGESGTTAKLMTQMHDEGEMSPAGFSNSVHNAMPGHFSLLFRNRAPYTAIAAGPDSYDMGLLEASTYPGTVLFVYAEEETPALYRPLFKEPQISHALALVMEN